MPETVGNRVSNEGVYTLLSFNFQGWIKTVPEGLPWWLSGKESACQCTEHSFDPWFRKIPHAAELLNPYTTTIEPVL